MLPRPTVIVNARRRGRHPLINKCHNNNDDDNDDDDDDNDDDDRKDDGGSGDTAMAEGTQ
jgi:hypothetical protein